MVVKNPFLSEKDYDERFLIRDNSLYRVLANLFPGASLNSIIKITKIAYQYKLPSTPVRIVTSSKKSKSGRSVAIISRATKVVKDFCPELSLQSIQNYLDLMCELRILRKLPGGYFLHSFGIPLALLEESEIEVKNSLKLKSYFLERILFEDGDAIKAILNIFLKKEIEFTSRNIGIQMHKDILMKIEHRLVRNKKIKHSFRIFLERRKEQYQKIANEEVKTWRRTELDYTVRRDWLIDLGLIIAKNESYSISEEGRLLISYINKNEITLNFFTNYFFSVAAELFNFSKINVNLNFFEDAFMILTKKNQKIIETLVVINYTLFSSIPNYIGEREDLLSILKDGSNSGLTDLIVESGYRTKDYYIKIR